MTVCLKEITVSGSQVLAVDTAATDLTTCVYVVESGLEQLSGLPALDATDGALLGSAIVGCWLIGWAIKQAIRALNVGEPNEEN